MSLKTAETNAVAAYEVNMESKEAFDPTPPLVWSQEVAQAIAQQRSMPGAPLRLTKRPKLRAELLCKHYSKYMIGMWHFL